MQKKTKIGLYLLSLVATGAIFGVGGFLLAENPPTFVNFGEKNQEIVTNKDNLEEIYQLYNTITQNYYQEVDQDKLVEGAMKGMTEALGDPYSTYLDTEGASALSESLADSFEGIGATLSLKDELPYIAQAPIKGSPAQKAGLKVNDVIVKVEGEAVKGQDLNEIVKKIRGKKNTRVNLTIQRNADEFEVEVKRDRIPLETVQGQLVEKTNIGYVQITTFGEGTTKEFQQTIETLRKAGAKGFILDVRQNPGGLLERVQEMASMFLKDGQVIVQFEDSQKNRSKTAASKDLDGGFKVSEPAVVLVDGNSASAAEIFAAALKESAGYPVIGTQTFGKGTMQQVAEISDSSELKLTVAKWLTPKGEWLHEKGLTPTKEADYPSYAYLPPLSRSDNYQEKDQGKQVDYLNQFLKALGYETKGDSFTKQTKEAVKEIQKKSSLKETGIVDAKTADAIEAEVTKTLQGKDFALKAAEESLKETLTKGTK